MPKLTVIPKEVPDGCANDITDNKPKRGRFIINSHSTEDFRKKMRFSTWQLMVPGSSESSGRITERKERVP